MYDDVCIWCDVMGCDVCMDHDVVSMQSRMYGFWYLLTNQQVKVKNTIGVGVNHVVCDHIWSKLMISRKPLSKIQNDFMENNSPSLGLVQYYYYLRIPMNQPP